jgi:L-ascorbate metabolism protein UlaG (beta-lactamase superfamily)
MKLKYLGHASFLVTSADGIRLQFDPYQAGGYEGQFRYGKFVDPADMVVISHNHRDHNDIAGVPGNPQEIKGVGTQTEQGITFHRVTAFHDNKAGGQRGEDIITVCEIDGVRLCHTGDLGHQLSIQQIEELGQIDVLCLPVGGYFTVDAEEATKVMESLAPRICIPMHYKTSKTDFPIAGVEDFLKGKAHVKRLGASEVEITQQALPQETEVWVLEPAL